MAWSERLFKGKKVWVLTDEEGALVLEKGLVPMRYSNDESAKTYSAHPRNLGEPGKAKASGGSKGRSSSGRKAKRPSFDDQIWREPQGERVVSTEVPVELVSEAPPADGVVEVYTDGACSGNPGPCGFGLLIRDGDDYREISQYVGTGTNNIGELMAIQVALDELEGTGRPVDIYTDSSYAIGVLTKGWKAKANAELIEDIRARLAAFTPKPRLKKVKGHAGHPLNERADALATGSIVRRS